MISGQTATITTTLPASMGGSACSVAITAGALSTPALSPLGVLMLTALLALAGVLRRL